MQNTTLPMTNWFEPVESIGTLFTASSEFSPPPQLIKITERQNRMEMPDKRLMITGCPSRGKLRGDFDFELNLRFGFEFDIR